MSRCRCASEHPNLVRRRRTRFAQLRVVNQFPKLANQIENRIWSGAGNDPGDVREPGSDDDADALPRAGDGRRLARGSTLLPDRLRDCSALAPVVLTEVITLVRFHEVVLPDNSQLELPDGATGLDAARAIGAKLAEQAVLVRADGTAQDLAAARPTVRRSSSSPPATRAIPTRSTCCALGGAPARGSRAAALSGREDRDRPPIENGFYYDFEFPEPITEADLAKIEDEVKREPKEGRDWSRETISRGDAIALFEAEAEPYKVELVDTAEGEITLYSRETSPTSARGRTSRPRSRSRRSS